MQIFEAAQRYFIQQLVIKKAKYMCVCVSVLFYDQYSLSKLCMGSISFPIKHKKFYNSNDLTQANLSVYWIQAKKT